MLETLPGLRPGLIGMKLAERKVAELSVQGSRDRCRSLVRQVLPGYEG